MEAMEPLARFLLTKTAEVRLEATINTLSLPISLRMKRCVAVKLSVLQPKQLVPKMDGAYIVPVEHNGPWIAMEV